MKNTIKNPSVVFATQKNPGVIHRPKKIPFGQNVRPKKTLRTPPSLKYVSGAPGMFTVGVFLLFYATPLGVIAPVYSACIGCSLHSDDRTMRKFSQQQGPGNRQFQALVRKRSRSNVVIVKTFLFGAVAFAICLLPYHVMWLWHDFGQGGRWTHFEDTLVFANALVYFNSLVNPFI